MQINQDAPGMKGVRPRLHDGRLKPLHGNTKLETIEDRYMQNYFPGLPNEKRGIITLGDARKYFSAETGEKVVGVKRIRELAIDEYMHNIHRVFPLQGQIACQYL